MKFKVKSDSGYAQWQMEQNLEHQAPTIFGYFVTCNPLATWRSHSSVIHAAGVQKALTDKRTQVSHRSTVCVVCFIVQRRGICCHNWMRLGRTFPRRQKRHLSLGLALFYLSLSRSPAPIIYGIWLCRRGVGEAAKRTWGAAKINLSLAARAIIITQNIIQLRARALVSRFARSGVSLFTT